MPWGQFAGWVAGLVLPLFTYLVGIRKNRAEIAKLEAERSQMHAEVARIVAETYESVVSALRSEVDRLRARVDELEMINADLRAFVERENHD